MTPHIPDDMVERAISRISKWMISSFEGIEDLEEIVRSALAEAVMDAEDEICAFLESIHHHSTAAAIRARQEQSK